MQVSPAFVTSRPTALRPTVVGGTSRNRSSSQRQLCLPGTVCAAVEADTAGAVYPRTARRIGHAGLSGSEGAHLACTWPVIRAARRLRDAAKDRHLSLICKDFGVSSITIAHPERSGDIRRRLTMDLL